jgi:hypothetical protein
MDNFMSKVSYSESLNDEKSFTSQQYIIENKDSHKFNEIFSTLPISSNFKINNQDNNISQLIESSNQEDLNVLNKEHKDNHQHISTNQYDLSKLELSTVSLIDNININKTNLDPKHSFNNSQEFSKVPFNKTQSSTNSPIKAQFSNTNSNS